MLPALPDASVDLILVDPPYGTTACSWDTVIPFAPMWAAVWRLLKPHCAALFFGSEPFSTSLRTSALANYKYDWYWDKKFGGNFVQAKRMPLKTIECISVFAAEPQLPRYFPQMTKRERPIRQGGTGTGTAIPVPNNASTHTNKVYTEKFPVTELRFPKELGQTVHPTQKPVPLLEYLIRTYTEAGETVLDFAAGSGSTGVAALQTGRRFIGIEREPVYAALANRRMEEVTHASR